MNEQNIFGIHAQALRLRAQRASILATNLANVNTPGYRAKDMDFNEVMQGMQRESSTLQTTNSQHMRMAVGNDLGFRLKYRLPLQDSLDGNTVDMQQERSAFTQNALMYQTSLRFLNGRIQGLMSALRGE